MEVWIFHFLLLHIFGFLDTADRHMSAGGGATGHPAEWIQLDNRDGATPAVCKYCGLRFVMDESKKEDESLTQKLVSRTFP